jgi:putative membrane protein
MFGLFGIVMAGLLFIICSDRHYHRFKWINHNARIIEKSIALAFSIIAEISIGKGERAMTDSVLPAGLVAGLTATLPMTVVMEVGHALLPDHERYSLPPAEILHALEEKTLDKPLPKPVHSIATVIGHFMYGSMNGGVYAAMMSRLPGSPLLRGSLFGLGLWMVSYLGWLPAAGILQPASKHPARRRALMILAHLVWGSVTGVLADSMNRKS